MKILIFTITVLASAVAAAKGNVYEVVGRLYHKDKMVSEMSVLALEGESSSIELSPYKENKKMKITVNEVSHKKIDDALEMKLDLTYNKKNFKMEGRTRLVLTNGAEVVAFSKNNKLKDDKYEFRVAVMRQPLRY